MTFKTHGFITTLTALLLTTGSVQAQDNRYYNIQQATHISAGWVAYSNGELYQCQMPTVGSKRAPSCLPATGLPSSIQSVSLLWAEGDQAWVSYTDGQVYGCRSSKNKAPQCLIAVGLP